MLMTGRARSVGVSAVIVVCVESPRPCASSTSIAPTDVRWDSRSLADCRRATSPAAMDLHGARLALGWMHASMRWRGMGVVSYDGVAMNPLAPIPAPFGPSAYGVNLAGGALKY